MKTKTTELDLHKLRRKILWRAQHRGTRELDILLGGYAEKKVPSMQAVELEKFDNFLALSENDLKEKILYLNIEDQNIYGDLIYDIRVFYGIKQ